MEMNSMSKPYKVAVVVNKTMAYSIFDHKDYRFLSEFADVNPLEDLPEKITVEFMQNFVICFFTLPNNSCRLVI